MVPFSFPLSFEFSGQEWQLVHGCALFWPRENALLVADLHLPGPVERARFLGIELVPGALDGAEGLVAGCGRRAAGARQAA